MTVIGRCFGALFGGMAYSEYPDNFEYVHRSFTYAAAVVAIMYFTIYHFYLKQKCAAPVHLPPDPAPAVVQSEYFFASKTKMLIFKTFQLKINIISFYI